MSSFEDLDDLRERNKQLLVRLREQRMRLQCLTAVATDPDCLGSGEIQRRPADSSRHSSASPVGSVVTEIGGRHGLARTSLSKPKTLDEDHPPAASHKKAQDVSEISTLGKDIVPLRAPSQREGGSPHHNLLQDERNIDLGREKKSEAMTSGLDFRSVGVDQHNGNSLIRRSTEPLLGYDWIAGLLDADSSLDDRTDQFFTELHNFRQVNKEECIHSPHTWVERDEISPPSLLMHELAMEYELDKHTCMFRYRINSRLFPTPLDCQAACAMCQMPKSQHAHTVAEPAFIRVSVPCAVLLPAHRQRAHHRNSFDPSNTLGLSSHCLSGWSRSAPVAARLPSSLDLRSSLDKVLPEPELVRLWGGHVICLISC
uniref:Migration and invasion inhibitory protein n=1 Tax=Paramormyrops kingsleyae TaxID=1676925 RepID=A0A3B3SSU8_9TELE